MVEIITMGRAKKRTFMILFKGVEEISTRRITGSIVASASSISEIKERAVIKKIEAGRVALSSTPPFPLFDVTPCIDYTPLQG